MYVVAEDNKPDSLWTPECFPITSTTETITCRHAPRQTSSPYYSNKLYIDWGTLLLRQCYHALFAKRRRDTAPKFDAVSLQINNSKLGGVRLGLGCASLLVGVNRGNGRVVASHPFALRAERNTFFILDSIDCRIIWGVVVGCLDSASMTKSCIELYYVLLRKLLNISIIYLI